MAAELRRVLMAVGILSMRAAALRQGLEGADGEAGEGREASDFIPGVAGRAPHLQTRPAIQRLPAARGPGHRVGAPLQLPQGQGHLTMMANSPQNARWLLPGHLRVPEPRSAVSDVVHAHIEAMPIIEQWGLDAASAELAALSNRDLHRAVLMKRTQESLDAIKQNFHASIPDYVFALTRVKSAGDLQVGDIQAIATARKQFQLSLDAGNKELLFCEMAVIPAAGRDGGVAPTLLASVIDWAGHAGREVVLAPASREIDEYYLRVGSELSIGRDKFQMVSLDMLDA